MNSYRRIVSGFVEEASGSRTGLFLFDESGEVGVKMHGCSLCRRICRQSCSAPSSIWQQFRILDRAILSPASLRAQPLFQGGYHLEDSYDKALACDPVQGVSVLGLDLRDRSF